MSASIERALATCFKLSSFRKGQREIIESVLANRDALAVMPTGGGKSLCYQLPAMISESIVVVISPLISLMDDQVLKMKGLGIPCGALHSGKTLLQRKSVFSEMRSSPRFLLYLSPERVQKEGFREWISKSPISLFAIDEAHCVSQWGPDFREDYYRLNILREIRGDVPILALTASATPQILKDIERRLKLKTPDRHVYGFYRPNLYYQVEQCESDQEKMALLTRALLQTPKGRILVYCGTRDQSECLAHSFKDQFGKIAFYHAGMTSEARQLVQQGYDSGAVRILCATNAFGMGIDHADVRLVVHYQMPANIEHYYQEMGRAGRDGLPATCLMLYSRKDKGLQAYFISKSEADTQIIRRRWNGLNTIVQFAEGAECRHAGILTYFRDAYRIKTCGHCDICDPSGPERIARVYQEVSAHRKQKDKKTLDEAPLSTEEELRYEVLREWRKDYAEEHDIAAFIVFSNRTLRDLVRKKPKSLSELGRVYGFGDHKVETLGTDILRKLDECEG